MIRTSHAARELLRNLYRNPRTSLGALLSLALLFLLFDLFWIGAGTSEKFYDDLLSDLNMEVFLAEDVVDSSLGYIQGHLWTLEGVRSVEYISKELAREQLSSMVGVDLLVGYDTINPLPRSYVIAFEADYLTSNDLTAIEKEITSMDGVSHVFYSRNWLAKAERTKGIILDVGMILGALILLTALINSINNIRLMTRARAVGFYQMRLLGAGKLFLAFPFIIEGFLISGLAAAAGWTVIFYWKDRLDFTRFEVIYPSLEEVLIFCGLAALLGILSGYLGIRGLLKL